MKDKETVKIKPNGTSHEVYEYEIYQNTPKAYHLRVSGKGIEQLMDSYFWVPKSALHEVDNVFCVKEWFYKIADRVTILALGRTDLLNDINFNS